MPNKFEATQALPSVVEAKVQAKRLRIALAQKGQTLSHSQSLELLSKQHGFNDWNTMSASINNPPQNGWHVGDRIRGRYLSQQFCATIISVTAVRPAWFRLAIDLDEAVDVVKFDSFSAFRKRIHGTVGPDGHTREKTSDGVPHLQIER